MKAIKAKVTAGTYTGEDVVLLQYAPALIINGELEPDRWIVRRLKHGLDWFRDIYVDACLLLVIDTEFELIVHDVTDWVTKEV